MLNRFYRLWERSLALREQELAAQRLAIGELQAVLLAQRDAVKDVVGCATILAQAASEQSRALSTYFATYREALQPTPTPEPFSLDALKALLVDEADVSADPLTAALP